MSAVERFGRLTRLGADRMLPGNRGRPKGEENAMGDTTKWLFLWRAAPGTPIRSFAASAPGHLAARLQGSGAREAVVHLTEEASPRLTPLPYRNEALALIGLRGEDGLLEKARAALRDLPGTLEGWRVEESVPVPRARTGPAGTPAPGACLLTLFRKNPRLGREEFFQEWYGRHTPLSLEIHPMVGYVRNAVAEPVLPRSGSWDGIVTEDFAERADLVSLSRLFGGRLRALPNMVRVGRHVAHFLHFPSIENYFVVERVLPLG